MVLCSSGLAFAQDQGKTQPPAAESSRGFRNGFSLSGGKEFGGSKDVSATMFGVDWRIGSFVTEAFSIYLHSHLSFGKGKEGKGASGGTGTFASALMAEYTFPFRLFVAAGGGYGVLNNPRGSMFAARTGFYPFGINGDKARRLNIALDYRAYFASQGYGTVNQIQFSLGYDWF
jgi:hypothetical protein